MDAMNVAPGSYTFQLIARVENGDEITRTEETFMVEYKK